MSAPVTEAHRKLVAAIIRDLSIDDGVQLIADSEAKATDQLRAEVERLKTQVKDDNRSYGCELRDPYGTIWEQAAKDHARAERAEAMLGKLQELHGCSQEMVVHWCEHAAKRSLELDFQVARNSDLFTERDEAVEAQGKAEAELATERARLDYLSTRGFQHRHHETGDHLGYEWTISSYSESKDVTLRDVIDAEMQEEAK